MKAVILTAKAGGHLFPFGAARPKCMLPVVGSPLLEKTLSQLREVGVTEVYLVVGHQKQVIYDQFKNGNSHSMQLRYLEQKTSSGIGTALQLAEESLRGKSLGGEPFLLVYGDVLASGNPFPTMLDQHAESGGSVAALALPPMSGEFGTVYMGSDMLIQRFEEKPQDRERANHVLAGFYLLEIDFFTILKKNQGDMASSLKELVSQGRLHGVRWEGEWVELRRPWHILEANRMLMSDWNHAVISKNVRLEGEVRIEGAVHIEDGAHIRPGSVLCGPCWIGAGCFIGNNTLIREYTSIHEKCSVGYGSELKNCVLLPQVEVGRLSFIAESVIGERTHIGTGVTTVNNTSAGGTITVTTETDSLDSGQQKLGAFIGDDVWLGARHVLAPGTVVASGSQIKDLLTLSSLVRSSK